MELTKRQQSILTGSLLGDGNINKPKYGNCSFKKGQKLERKPYLEWMFNELQPFSSSVIEYNNKCKGKIYPASRFSTRANSVFNKFREEWYPRNKKAIPENLTLDSLSLAIWFFDDGYNDVQNRCCSLAANGFTRNECEWLCKKIEEELAIESYVKNTVNVIVTKTCSYKKFVQMVSPFMLWDCFKYKIRYRDRKDTTDAEALKIFDLSRQGRRNIEIAEITGKSQAVISNILLGKTTHKKRLVA